MKEEEQVEGEAPQVSKDSENKHLETNEDHLTITPTDPSPSLSPYSLYTPPSLRSRNPPSPPLHSSPDSSISDDHFSINHALSPPHDNHFSPPPQNSPPLGSSSESSIFDDHCSVNDGIPPIEKQHFSLTPTHKPASPVVVANRFQVETKVLTKVDPGATEGVVGVGDAEEGADTAVGHGGGSSNKGRLRPDMHNFLKLKKEEYLKKILLGLRIIGLVFCLISFSVLAADIKQGWALDSFYLYKEFRYSLSVNIIGFVYSLLQICDLIKYFITKSHIVEHRLRNFFNFTMDPPGAQGVKKERTS